MAKSSKVDIEALYEKFYGGDKARHGVFTALAKWLSPKKVLYAGGFIHVNASFVFPSVVYVDTDKNAKKFFSQMPDVIDLVDKHKEYSSDPKIGFHGQSYESKFDEELESFDLLISLYAGPISQACFDYLKPGGILLVNNSHADAGLASVDKRYEFVGVLKGSGDKLKFSEDDLAEYFKPKKDLKVTKKYLLELGKGVGYTKTAPVYIFRKK